MVDRLILGPLDTNCWIVSDGAGGPIVIIDPADDADAVLATVGDRRVAAIVLTHGHFDHIGGVRGLVETTGAPVLVHAADADAVTSPERSGATLFGFDVSAPAPHRLLEDGDRIEAGALGLQVLHTPGHTPGSISLVCLGHVFTGDTLFAGSVGRTDFPGGDPRAMRASIARIALLPDETLVHPGHGPDTTIGRERRLNPFFPRA